MPIDLSAGTSQEYIEDCPVCCRPNVIHVEIDEDGDVRVWAEGVGCCPIPATFVERREQTVGFWDWLKGKPKSVENVDKVWMNQEGEFLGTLQGG